MPEDCVDYLTDVEYTGNFFGHLAPAWLCYIAAINGYAAPCIDRPFTWCELGCGKGVTPLVLAATHPGGTFYGCDINPAHIEQAQSLRAAANLGNARFYAKRFGDMLREDVPAFDFITLHGVYSWVPDAARDEIHELIRRKLKPGGLLMVSYNAMPGWAHLLPVREMMRMHAKSVSGDSLAKAGAAFGFVERLAREGALYFRTLPAAAAHLKHLSQQDIRYVAHEYLTPHCEPFYFARVNEAMQAIGLAFAGSMTPKDNYLELMVPAELQPLMANARSRAELETLRDFVVNTGFRQDLYAAQTPVERDRSISLAAFDAIDFCLLAPPPELTLKRTEPPLVFDLEAHAAAVRAVHAALAEGPASARDLHLRVAMADEALTALLQQLVVAGHIAPCPSTRTARGWPKLNTVLIDAAIRDEQPEVPLASPWTGSASYSELVYAAALEATVRCDDASMAAQRVLERFRVHRHPINRLDATGERRPATDAEVLEYVSLTWRRLRDAEASRAGLLRLFGWL